MIEGMVYEVEEDGMIKDQAHSQTNQSCMQVSASLFLHTYTRTIEEFSNNLTSR